MMFRRRRRRGLFVFDPVKERVRFLEDQSRKGYPTIFYPQKVDIDTFHMDMILYLLDERRSYNSIPCFSYSRVRVLKKLMYALHTTKFKYEGNHRIAINLKEFCAKNGDLSYLHLKGLLKLLRDKGYIVQRRLKNRRSDNKSFHEIVMSSEPTHATFKIGKPKLKVGTRGWLRSLELVYYAKALEEDKEERCGKKVHFYIHEYSKVLARKSELIKKRLERDKSGSVNTGVSAGHSSPSSRAYIETSIQKYSKSPDGVSSCASVYVDFEKRLKEASRRRFLRTVEEKYGDFEVFDSEGLEIAKGLMSRGLSRVQVGQFFERFSCSIMRTALKNTGYYDGHIFNKAGFLWRACEKASRFRNWKPKWITKLWWTDLTNKIYERICGYKWHGCPWHYLKLEDVGIFSRFTWECVSEAMESSAIEKRNVVNANALLYSMCMKAALEDNSLFSEKYKEKHGIRSS
jgi:hypothetical protein